MRRYWIEESDVEGDWVTFQGEIFHHIVEVCRQLPPARFEVLIPSGQALFVEMTEVQQSKRHPMAKARVLETRTITPLKKPYLQMVLCLGRFSVVESVLEKMVELGVHSVHLVFSDFSFVKSSDKVSDSRLQRWQKIVRMATQQTGRGELMTLHPPQPLENLLQQAPWLKLPSQGLFFYEGEGGTLKSWVDQQRKSSVNTGLLENIWIFVGAEGGFSEREVQTFRAKDLVPLSLGAQVLRVETACVSVVSILKYLYDL